MNLGVLRRNVPFIATLAVFALLFLFASVRYKGFFTLPYLVSFVSADAYLGIAALGLTFVILSGGIDLSVGAVIGCVSVLIGVLVEKHHVPASVAVAIALVFGTLLGTGMGAVIHYFGLPPFLVTLAGMFLARGVGFLINLESLPVGGALAEFNTAIQVPLSARASIPGTTLLYLLLFVLAFVLAHFTRFGRNVYAIGGNEQSALLMGLPVARTKIGVYALNGLFSALAGVTYVLQNIKGDPTAGFGLELDAIAAVVIGGTLLTGGVGLVTGTIVGVMILGVIQAIIAFQGTLSSWWTKIVVGVLLLAFIMLQRSLQSNKAVTERWNWGAFTLSWIWAVGNRVPARRWIWALVPGVNVVWLFVLGARGSRWAFEARQWKSPEKFLKVQRLWAAIGIVIQITLWLVLLRR